MEERFLIQTMTQIKKHKGGGSRLGKTENKKFFEKVAVKNRIFIPTTYDEYFFKHKKEVAHE